MQDHGLSYGKRKQRTHRFHGVHTCLDFGGRRKVVGIPPRMKQKLWPKSSGHGVDSYKYDTCDEHDICAMGYKQQ